MILPSSFAGSPRSMQQNYQDAMAMVSKYGKPDLFLTFTCNPRHKDIVDNLLERQTASDRPDIVARVFKVHLEELMKDIRQKHVLGVPVAHIYVIEYQKRGLPHAHFLIILADGSKLREPRDIDTIISAEILDVALSQLLSVVKSCMIHGPCGSLNKKAPCLEAGKCTKDFPKPFQHETKLSEDGYPKYCRSENGHVVTINVAGIPTDVDNRWVVPYNPFLSQKYNAHINVEACTSVRSVKYLFKYVYKGHDCANLEVTESDTINHDELKQYLDAHYVSAPEAYWRIAAFKMFHRSHSITRLALHLPDQQSVFFATGNHEQAAAHAAVKDTTLTAFFKYNNQHQTNLCYNEFPLHYTFKDRTKRWGKRGKSAKPTIGRIYSASPKDIERFCLRLLLLNVPGLQAMRICEQLMVNCYQISNLHVLSNSFSQMTQSGIIH